MLSKAQIKHIQLLQRNKGRRQYLQYLVEGDKMVRELLESDEQVEHVFALQPWLAANEKLLQKAQVSFEEINQSELKKISSLVTPNQVLAVVNMPNRNELPKLEADKLYLALDGLQDPGNMGTVIRTADWFGIDAIFCSPECVDMYNPKVVQATMSGLLHVPVYITELKQLLAANPSIPSFAAVMEGISVYENQTKSGIIIIGNEGAGVSEEVLKAATHTISIPRVGKAESLNAAMATGILLSWFRGQV